MKKRAQRKVALVGQRTASVSNLCNTGKCGGCTLHGVAGVACPDSLSCPSATPH